MKRLSTFLLCMIILFTLSSCSTQAKESEKLGGMHTDQGDLYPENFLKFDGKTVSFNEFRYYYLNYRDMYLKEDGDYFSTQEREDDLKAEVLQCLLDDWAVKFLANEKHIKLTSEEKKAVQNDIESTMAVYGDKEAFLKDLHSSYMSLDHYESKMEYSSLYLKLFDSLFREDGKEAFTDEEFYAYYKENYLAVQQIFLKFVSGEKKDHCPETLAKAKSIYEEATQGADFWLLVETYGEDTNMLSYPDGYYFTQGEAEDELYEASKALDIGQVGEAVVTESGVYIIKRMELKKLRMDENRETALFGYWDTMNEWHAGAYDQVFFDLYRSRADKIKVEYSQFWDQISTKTVY